MNDGSWAYIYTQALIHLDACDGEREGHAEAATTIANELAQA